MKIILDDTLNNDLKESLLIQDAITNVDFTKKGFLTEVNIDFDETTNHKRIMEYIEKFQKYKYSTLFEFDKCYTGDFKTLKYIVDDICCEYCYKGLVRELFENELIKSVKSNYNIHEIAFDVEFIIEYFKDYDENELIEYIKEKL